MEACKKEGIAYEEVQVANDGLAVVVNPGERLGRRASRRPS